MFMALSPPSEEEGFEVAEEEVCAEAEEALFMALSPASIAFPEEGYAESTRFFFGITNTCLPAVVGCAFDDEAEAFDVVNEEEVRAEEEEEEVCGKEPAGPASRAMRSEDSALRTAAELDLGTVAGAGPTGLILSRLVPCFSAMPTRFNVSCRYARPIDCLQPYAHPHQHTYSGIIKRHTSLILFGVRIVRSTHVLTVLTCQVLPCRPCSSWRGP